MSANLEYRGARGTTFQLVLLAFLVGTLMLVLGHIDGAQWTTGVIGLVSAYVVRDAAAKAAEAYRDKPTGGAA